MRDFWQATVPSGFATLFRGLILEGTNQLDTARFGAVIGPMIGGFVLVMVVGAFAQISNQSFNIDPFEGDDFRVTIFALRGPVRAHFLIQVKGPLP